MICTAVYTIMWCGDMMVLLIYAHPHIADSKKWLRLGEWGGEDLYNNYNDL